MGRHQAVVFRSFSTGVAATLLLGSAALAEDGVSGFVSLGVGAAPEFRGADDYQIIPFATGRFELGGATLDVRGPRVSADILPFFVGQTGFSAGPVVAYRGGRDDVENNQVDALDDIDGAFEVGGSIGYAFAPQLMRGDAFSINLTALFDVTDAHGGFVTTVSVGYSAQLTQRLRMGVSLNTSIADENYMSTFFSVDAQGAAASGLSTFDADGGFESVGVGLNATYAFTQSWGANVNLSYLRLIGDAGESSIVDEAGSENQFFGGVGLFYRF